MGGLPIDLATELRDALGLRRAIETGTYRGGGARLLAGLFPAAFSIELSEELHRAATEELRDVGNVTLVQGDSRTELPRLVDPAVPTLYFLDGHWSGGPTAGEQAECPVGDEIAALAGGHPSDCVLIDDARLFCAPPPPPHDPAQWPALVEVLDALRAAKPGHHCTVLADLIIAVPAEAREIVDRFGQRLPTSDAPAAEPPRTGLRARLARTIAPTA